MLIELPYLTISITDITHNHIMPYSHSDTLLSSYQYSLIFTIIIILVFQFSLGFTLKLIFILIIFFVRETTLISYHSYTHSNWNTFFQITESYAFLPREAVTKFLMCCSDCQKRTSHEERKFSPTSSSGDSIHPPSCERCDLLSPTIENPSFLSAYSNSTQNDCSCDDIRISPVTTGTENNNNSFDLSHTTQALNFSIPNSTSSLEKYSSELDSAGHKVRKRKRDITRKIVRPSEDLEMGDHCTTLDHGQIAPGDFTEKVSTCILDFHHQFRRAACTYCKHLYVPVLRLSGWYSKIEQAVAIVRIIVMGSIDTMKYRYFRYSYR